MRSRSPSLSSLISLPSLLLATPALADDEPGGRPPALECPIPDEAAPGPKLVLRCRVPQGAVTALLFYRLPGSEEFTPVPTLRADGWFTGTLHRSDLHGASFQYYVEARDADDEVVARHGDEESPNLMFLVARAPAPSPTAAAPRPPGDEPLLVRDADRDEPRRREDPRRRATGSIFVGMGVGVGYGWHPQRRLEFRDDLYVDPGVGFAGLPHLMPEIGYQIAPRVALSLQGRWQRIGSSGAGEGRAGRPAGHAWAALARACYFLGQGRFHFFGSAALGAGDAVRVEVLPVEGLPRTDTVAGGPLVLGPGAGFLFHIAPRVAWQTELRGLVGVPRGAAVLDLGTGLQVAF